MKKTIIITATIFLALISILFFNLYQKTEKQSFQTITAAKAKEMIDQNPNVIILDVRTNEEYLEGHIENATLLPYDTIPQQAEITLPDTSSTILVYCRSGRRSAIAAQSLVDLGYSNVYDFGGIIDWPYSVVTGE
ncbi:MAG: rhodanese-like domain-containing protein [Lachnospiraceae bacterium]|nr:rhodanese-like domain-containing protein [Lachnospiraceae bacterium]